MNLYTFYRKNRLYFTLKLLKNGNFQVRTHFFPLFSHIFFFIEFYRSEDVELFKVTVHKDNHWNIINELGKMN